MTEHIIVERPEAYPGVMVIRFNRPEKKNAITAAMYHRMTAALEEANTDEALRAVVFLGTEGCFSAGNDMGDFLAHAMSGTTEAPAAAVFIKALALAEKPLVSGVDGLAIGIGTTLNLHCDMTVASNRSMFRTPFVDLALVPEAASSLLAPRVMGHQRAFALLVAGEGFSAEAALEAGLVWKVVEPDAVKAETLAVAATLAKKPPQALKIARDLVRGPRDEILARMDEELVHFSTRLKSAEARAAFEAFMRR
ncbi:Enoyl-CoA hydratase/carnithine racemase [Rhizobium sp. NFR07]|uniref:crotonase/enoyl-CoA hydratase family protein n=1 Tax=Rhizobium sp. NFR07 TaxID=1566262 RepID=UPI0008E25EA3|nr:crotonase/enoyl-CoA hydratase family protein [Rhizobium sp. NFR07]SFB06855.1 Enoyl-CoA hydratase/carnithine racemase [Rhizobium sp. NFR07]